MTGEEGTALHCSQTPCFRWAAAFLISTRSGEILAIVLPWVNTSSESVNDYAFPRQILVQ